MTVAPSCGPPVDGASLTPFEGQRVGWHIGGDGRARADVCPLPDLDRRHQHGVRTDERAVTDRGLELGEPVVVDGDGTGAEVHVAAQIGVADVGQMRNL